MYNAPLESSARERQLLARIGGACAMVGTFILIASLAPHGDLPTHVSVEAALRFIADHRSWYVIHLGTLVAPLVWVCAFSALAGSVTSGAARAIGRLLVPIATLGAVFSVFTFSIDGYVFKMVADTWATSSGEEQAQAALILTMLLKLLNGPFRIEIMIWYGLTFMLAGLVVCAEARYSTVVGAIGAVAGALGTLAGLASLAGWSITLGSIPLPLDRLVFLLTMPIEGAWMVVLGVLMWRRAGRARSATQTPALA
jgi:hypothetical protein